MSERPLAVLLAGLPGAGKSRVARALARESGWTRIDRDTLRAELFPRPSGSAEEKEAANRAVLAALAGTLAAGRSGVIDGMTFAGVSQRFEFRREIAAAGGCCRFVLLECPPEVAARRIAGDGAPHPAVDRTPALVFEVARRFRPPDDDWFAVDATQPFDSVLECVRRVAERDWV